MNNIAIGTRSSFVIQTLTLGSILTSPSPRPPARPAFLLPLDLTFRRKQTHRSPVLP